MERPIARVAKKQGRIRLACDYSYSNVVTISDVLPLCDTDDVIWRVSEGRFISTFEAKSRYRQLLLSPDCCRLTTFAIHEVLYEWVCMLF